MTIDLEFSAGRIPVAPEETPTYLQELGYRLEETFQKIESIPTGNQTTGLGNWRYRTETGTPPASGQIRFDNTDVSSATEFYLHETNQGGTDVGTFLELTLQAGSILYIQDQSDANNYMLIEIGSSVDNGVYRTYGITSLIEAGTEPNQNQTVLLVAGTTSTGVQAVNSVFGRTGAVVALVGDYDAFFLTPAEGDAAYLGIAAKAADSDLLDGLDSTAFSLTGHTHAGTVDTSGIPVALDFARFTDADTIEGRNPTEARVDLGLEIGVDVQAWSAILDATTASFLTADETKLDNIEPLADVTDTTNVTAAGALMDSEVDANLKTFVLPASTTISAFGASLVDDIDAPTARATLGAGTGDGNVSNSGTPLVNQIAVFIDATTIQGIVGFEYDGSTLAVAGDIDATGAMFLGTQDWEIRGNQADQLVIQSNDATASGIRLLDSGGIQQGQVSASDASGVGLVNQFSEFVVRGFGNLQTELFYNGAIKLSTLNDGVDIDGILDTSGGVDNLRTATGVVGIAAAAAPTVGQVLKATSAVLATWQDEAGGGNVSNTGTPLVDQIAVWVDATTIEGLEDFKFDSGADALTVGDGTVLGAAIHIDASATGNPSVQLEQAGTLKAFLQFLDVDEQLVLSGDGPIRLSPFNSQRALLETTTLTLGATGVSFTILGPDTDGELSMYAAGTADGGGIALAGSTHPTNPGDVQLRSNGQTWGMWDESAGEFEILTGVGAKTLALTIDASQDALFAGNIESIGFEDIATAKAMILGDTQLTMGAAGADFNITMVNALGVLGISAGVFGSGGALVLAGASHATNAGDVQFRSSGNNFFEWDESEGDLSIYSGIGASKPLALTIDVDQNVNIATQLVFNERSMPVGVPNAGEAFLFLKNEAPTELRWVDDTNVVHSVGDLLNTGGVSSGVGVYAFGGLQLGSTNALTFDGQNLTLSDSFMSLTFIETGVTANNSSWAWQVDGESMMLELYNDAFGASASAITVDRTLNVIDLITFGGPLKVDGASMEVGDGVTSFTFFQDIDTQFLGLFGGTLNNGANILMYGSTETLRPGDMRFRHDLDDWMIWDESVGDLEILTGIGSKTSALTITVNQSVEPTHFKWPIAPTADLEDIGNVINTGDAKTQGTTYFNNNTNSLVMAIGSASGSLWVDTDGNTVHTPV